MQYLLFPGSFMPMKPEVAYAVSAVLFKKKPSRRMALKNQGTVY